MVYSRGKPPPSYSIIDLFRLMCDQFVTSYWEITSLAITNLNQHMYCIKNKAKLNTYDISYFSVKSQFTIAGEHL